MHLKLAVFDLAGTTVADDNAVESAFQRALEVYGYRVQENDIKPLMGYKKPLAIRILLEKAGVKANEGLVEDIYREFETQMLDYYEYSPDVRAIPGAEDIMLLLKERGIKVALNTGFSRIIADKILHRLEWIEKGIADDFIASDEVEEGRPMPFMIQALMQRAGIDDPGEVIKIGDTEVDVNEGINAGCAIVVAVTTGAFTRDQLKLHAPDYIIDNLSELPALIYDRD